MNILILGGDGYLGWPTAMKFSARGDNVKIIDNFSKRRWELEEGITPLWDVPILQQRIKSWKELTGYEISLNVGISTPGYQNENSLISIMNVINSAWKMAPS